MNQITIGNNAYGERHYRIFIETCTMFLQEFHVYAYDETKALDLVADYCEENGLEGLYADYYEVFDLCDIGETVEEYAEAHNLICCGNHGIYVGVAGIEEI